MSEKQKYMLLLAGIAGVGAFVAFGNLQRERQTIRRLEQQANKKPSNPATRIAELDY